MHPDRMSVAEFARWRGQTRQAVYKQIKAGKLQVQRNGERIYVLLPPPEVDAAATELPPELVEIGPKFTPELVEIGPKLTDPGLALAVPEDREWLAAAFDKLYQQLLANQTEMVELREELRRHNERPAPWWRRLIRRQQSEQED